MTSLVLSNGTFNGGILIWMSGLPFIMLYIIFQNYKNLENISNESLHIKSVCQLENHIRNLLKLADEIQCDRKKYVLLVDYIHNHQLVCSQQKCPLKELKSLKNKNRSKFAKKEVLTEKLLLKIEDMLHNACRRHLESIQLRILFGFFELERM